MARFVEIYQDIENISNVINQRNLIKRACQRTLDRIAGFYPWPFYLERTFFTTVDDDTTGTVAVTNGSTGVTGTGTSFAAAAAGRKFRAGTDQAFYDIASRASGTSITLSQAYQGTTATAATFIIYQDEYRLNADVDILHFMRQIEDGRAMIEMDPGDFDILFPANTATNSDPSYLTPIGRRQDTYTTGTVSVTAGGTTLTGTDTAWTDVQGLSRGSRIRIDDTNEVFTVKSVDSATSITSYEQVVATDTSSAHTIFLDNLKVQIFEIPSAAHNIHYRYYRKPTPLINDYDEPDLPSNFHWLIVMGGLKEAWMHKGDLNRTRSAERDIQAGVREMQKHFKSISRVYRRKGQSMRGVGLRFPRYPRNFDVSVST